MPPKVHARLAAELPANAVVAMVEVDDPFEAGGRITVLRSVRDDPLAKLRARGSVDQAQFTAGRHWQKLFEAAEIGGVKAMDTTKEPVDGGRISDPLTERQRRAMAELGRISRAVGQDADALLRDVLGVGLFIEQCAQKRGIFGDRATRALSAKFKNTLDILSEYFGYSSRVRR